jgi:glycosyltransferase involved in cell wall biosynthesis
MGRPVVSVLIDTYNHESFIEQAILSVLEQDFPAAEWEILVVDDGSSDRTPEIVRKFEPQVRLLRKENGGQASAFNVGIPECKGEIVAFLDGDDWWAQAKLTGVMEAFAKNPSVGLIGHSITEVLADGSQRSELVKDTPRFRLDSEAGARAFRLRKSFLGTSRMACRSEILRRIGPVPVGLIIQADEYLFTMAALFADVLLLRPPLSFYRLHGQNLFQVMNGSEEALRRKQKVLEELARALRRRFVEENVPKEVAKAVGDSVQVEADLLRLSLDGGMPWETIRAELMNYSIMHENASFGRWILKSASLLPACFLSPRRYASLKQRFSQNSFYRRTRARWLPFLHPKHVDRTRQWGEK